MRWKATAAPPLRGWRGDYVPAVGVFDPTKVVCALTDPVFDVYAAAQYSR